MGLQHMPQRVPLAHLRVQILRLEGLPSMQRERRENSPIVSISNVPEGP